MPQSRYPVRRARGRHGGSGKEGILLVRAQEWLKLAYSRSEEEFERLLTQLNSEQMGVPVQRVSMQQQPQQQQQQRKAEDDK